MALFRLPLRVIAKQKLSGAAASVTFDLTALTIPAGTRHLAVIWNAQAATGGASPTLRLNNDSGSTYHRQRLSGVGASASASRVTATGIDLIPVVGLANTANLFGGGMVLIPHYANTANHKTVLSVAGDNENEISAVAARWADTGAITRIDIVMANDFVANSIFLLCAVDERFAVPGAEQLLAADGTVTFSNIPQLDGDLVVVGYCRTDRDDNVLDGVNQTINGDTTDANYASQILRGTGATTQAAANATRSIIPGGVDTELGTANAFSPFVVSISQHANGVKQPHYLCVAGRHESTTPSSQVEVISGRRANIAAITSLAYTPATGTNFKSGSLFSLYFVPKRLLDYTKLTADAASITHTVPAGYEVIFPSAFTRSDVAAATDSLVRSFNNDVTDANYDTQILTGDGSTVAAAQSAASRVAAVIPGASAGANIFGGGQGMIPAYTETDRHKHALSIDGAADDIVALRSMRWESLTAITEIDETDGGNFKGT